MIYVQFAIYFIYHNCGNIYVCNAVPTKEKNEAIDNGEDKSDACKGKEKKRSNDEQGENIETTREQEITIHFHIVSIESLSLYSATQLS